MKEGGQRAENGVRDTFSRSRAPARMESSRERARDSTPERAPTRN